MKGFSHIALHVVVVKYHNLLPKVGDWNQIFFQFIQPKGLSQFNIKMRAEKQIIKLNLNKKENTFLS